ncbi:MAG: hypothetical protein M3N43_06630 [Actinomycetota bacterium]|nr:hypothetical protein [Actinomycetota bacterium]
MSGERIVLVRQPTVVAVATAGVQGPKGDTGPIGPTGGETYEHVQVAAQSVWTINHNLGRYPTAWSLFDSSGRECGQYTIQHLDLDSLRVSMDLPTAGIIRLV